MKTKLGFENKEMICTEEARTVRELIDHLDAPPVRKRRRKHPRGASITMSGKIQPTKWEAASGATAQIGTKRDWFVNRYLDGPGVTGDTAKDGRGRIRTFATFELAQTFAEKLNGDVIGASEKFTPGPWEVDSGAVQTVREHDCKISGECGVHTPIAIMDRTAGNGVSPVERDYNARLIASTPELLDMLQELYAYVDCRMSANFENGTLLGRASRVIGAAGGDTRKHIGKFGGK